MRLIDADAPMEQLVSKHAHSWGKVERAYGEAIEALCNAPTVDAEPMRHGEWIGKCVNAGKHFVMTVVVPVCSECGTQAVNQEFTNYCPNCGAKMDGGKQDANV